MKRRALLGAAAASVALAGCGEASVGDGASEDVEEAGSKLHRHVDCEAGTVVYEQHSGDGTIEVVPINETDLEKEDFCNE